jgi:antitoxin component of RelBE/YafQ-DinJ toxin-antitoxin module
MACLTITVDSDVLERAYMQAALTGVPVKEVVREALAQFADGTSKRIGATAVLTSTAV